MAKAFCLNPAVADKFLNKIKSGDINPEKLSDMTSKERNAFLKDIVGERNAQGVNALFESKLLLKNQQRGMISWAKKVGGLSPQVRRDIIAKIERLDTVLTPQSQDEFLEDLVAQRLGFGISTEEAEVISKMTARVASAEDAFNKGTGSRMDWGRALHDLRELTGELKERAKKGTFIEDLKTSPIGAVGRKVSEAGGLSRSLLSSLDLSAIGRQGFKTMMTNPGIWLRNSFKAFKDAAQTLGGKDTAREVQADILTRPNRELYKKAGLAVSVTEEAFPTTGPAKIPGFGRFFKASEASFSNFMDRTRADVFDQYIDIFKRTGGDIADETQLKGIADVVNSLTGRGRIGLRDEALGAANNLFFAPRLIKAHVDTLLQPVGVGVRGGFGGFAQKRAAINLMKVIGGTAAILGTANALKPGSVEWDPRSSDFGKIKVNNTRFDVSGGQSQIITLASRILRNSTKSTSTGAVTELGPGFGKRSALDVFEQFIENKLSPGGGVIRDILKGEDFDGNKPTPASIAKNSLIPLPIQNAKETAEDPGSANLMAVMIADALGFGTNTFGSAYSNIKREHNSVPFELEELEEFDRLTKNNAKPSLGSIEDRVDWKTFKGQVDENKYQEALDDFTISWGNGVTRLVKSNAYKKADDPGKKDMLDKLKDIAEDEALQRAGFVKEKKKKKRRRISKESLGSFLKGN